MDDGFARALPKAELHVHIEGTLEPELMLSLAARNGVDLPFPDVAAARRAYEFSDLQSFLDVYYHGAAVLRTVEDFADLAAAYLRTAHDQGVRHVEMFFDPQTHTARGVPFAAVVDGLAAAIAEAEATLGISAALIMCFLRHLPPDSALETLDQALAHRDGIVGIGLDSSEIGYPPSLFAEVYRRGVAEGFVPVAHAGEEGPPAYVWEAIDTLGARRIDHGVRSMEDRALVRRLAADRIPVTVCPLSNVKLRVVDRLSDHVLPAMLDAGLMVSLNSDDPAYFGGYAGDNYAAVAAELPISRDDLVEIARQSFRSSFLPDERVSELLAEVDAVAASTAGR